MINQLLWLHVLFDGGLAALLLTAPALTIRALGLPSSGTSFWPRLIGGLLAGIALATLAGGMGWTKTGIGLGGHIAISTTVAFILLAMLVNGPELPTRRGRALLWGLVLGLIAISLVEVAYAE